MRPIHLPVLSLLIALPVLGEDPLHVVGSLGSDGAFQADVSTSFPADTCVNFGIRFEGELMGGLSRAAYVGKEGSAKASLGPFTGRTLLSGTYLIVASIDPTNQDARVAGFFKGKPPMEFVGKVQVGTPEEGAADRKKFVDYIAGVVGAAQAKLKEAKAGIDDLKASKRFVRASGGVDTTQFDQFVRSLLGWVQEETDQNAQMVQRYVAPYFPRVMQFLLNSYLLDCGIIFRMYAQEVYRDYRLGKWPPEYNIPAVVLPTREAMEQKCERDARVILQTIGAAPLRPLSEVAPPATSMPHEFQASPVPDSLAQAATSNPATLAKEDIAKVKDRSSLAPGVDLAGVAQVYWMGLDTTGDQKAHVDVWLIAYQNPEQREAAFNALYGTVKDKKDTDAVFGGEQFLCWVHGSGDVDLETIQKVARVVHDQLGW